MCTIELQDGFARSIVSLATRFLTGNSVNEKVVTTPLLRAAMRVAVHFSMIKAFFEALLYDDFLRALIATFVSIYVKIKSCAASEKIRSDRSIEKDP